MFVFDDSDGAVLVDGHHGEGRAEIDTCRKEREGGREGGRAVKVTAQACPILVQSKSKLNRVSTYQRR